MKLSSTHSACPGTGKSGPAHAELPRAGAGEPGLGLAGADVPGDSGPTFLPSPCCLPVLGPSGLWRCPNQPADSQLLPPWLWAATATQGPWPRLCSCVLGCTPDSSAPPLCFLLASPGFLLLPQHSPLFWGHLWSRVLEAPGGRIPMVLCPLSLFHTSSHFW